jgi:hypothetical protein
VVDTSDLKSDGRTAVPVQVRPEALYHETARRQFISRTRKMCLADESSRTQQLSHKLSRGGEHMTDSNGKPIKQITEAAAGKEKYYIIHYRDGSCRTFTRQTGTIKKWLSTQR